MLLHKSDQIYLRWEDESISVIPGPCNHPESIA